MISRTKSVISNNTFSEYNHVGIESHLSIRHTKGRIAQQYQFRRKPWLCVLSRIISAWCAMMQLGATGRTKVRFFHIVVGQWLVMEVQILLAHSSELQSEEIRSFLFKGSGRGFNGRNAHPQANNTW